LKLNMRMVQGIPDCWYSGTKTDLWVEWKYKKQLPATIDLTDKKNFLTANQELWLRQRHEEGRNVAVGLGTTKGGVLYFAGDIWLPKDREDFFLDAVPARELARLIKLFVSA